MNDLQQQIASLPLRDIHLPEEISWWPPALGWWLLLIGIMATCGLIAWIIAYKRKRRIRNHALSELDAYYARYQRDADPVSFVTELSFLLRRVCMAYFPAQAVAGLSGEKWLRFLDKLFAVKGIKKSFLDQSGRLLETLPYASKQSAQTEQISRLEDVARTWLKQFPLSQQRYKKIIQ